jgi:hypothetical protein
VLFVVDCWFVDRAFGLCFVHWYKSFIVHSGHVKSIFDDVTGFDGVHEGLVAILLDLLTKVVIGGRSQFMFISVGYF